VADQAYRQEERAQRDTAQPADLMNTSGRSDYLPTTLAAQPADLMTHHSHPVIPAPEGASLQVSSLLSAIHGSRTREPCLL